MEDALQQATVAELNEAFEAGRLTSAELTAASLKRIEAFDRRGPGLRAVLATNRQALDIAHALDAERRASGPRSPLHGTPVILKDNIDTCDMPTTAGSILLEGWRPARDATLAARLRAAGAVILAKANTTEFAHSSYGSLGGRVRNPHDLARTALGSSSGSAVAAAAYVPLTLGTDTGGSIRGPASVNGVAGLKPTRGLLSRAGIVPFALSLDAPGIMGRSVRDLALTLGLLTGLDAADPATEESRGGFASDYASGLSPDALQGARLGVARDFMGQDREVDWVVDCAMSALQSAGATLVEVSFPKWLLAAKEDFYLTVRSCEFAGQIGGYLAGTGPGHPKSLQDLIDRAARVIAPRTDGAGPNPARWATFREEARSGGLENPAYRVIRDHGLPMVRAAVEAMLAQDGLDAIIYPPMPQRPALASAADAVTHGPGAPTNIANLAGLPDLVVPAGFISDGLPVGLSFLGPAFSEAKLLRFGHALELAAPAWRLPVHTPILDLKDGDTV